MVVRILAVTCMTLLACGGDGGGAGGPDGGGGDGGGVDGAVATAGEHAFDPDVLHEVAITVAAADLDTLENNQDVRVRCTITFDGVTVADAGCKKKGTSSLRPLAQKVGFTVKMNEFVSGQKLDGLKKLALDSAIEDPSFLVGHLSYEVFRRAGLPAPRTAHTTLRFNGVDKGLFVVEESTDTQYLEAQFGDGTGNVYEGPWDFPKGAAAATLRDEVAEMRSRADIQALTGVVMSAPDAQLESQLAAQLDVDRLLTNFAVEEVAVLWDNYAVVAWNYYLYHVPGGRFVMLTHGINWPYFHADWDPFNLFQYPWGSMNDPPGYLCVRIRAIPSFDARYRAELLRVARDVWDVQALIARADHASMTLHSRALSGASAADLAAHDAHLTEVKSFIQNRRTFLAGLLGF